MNVSLNILCVKPLLQENLDKLSHYSPWIVPVRIKFKMNRISLSNYLILSVVAIFTLSCGEYSAQGQDHPPSAADLQSGDLIWPKKPGTVVPYDSRQGMASEQDAARWEQEKKAYLERLKAKRKLTPKENTRFTTLQALTYNEFKLSYLADEDVAKPTQYGTGLVYVGHVGIVQFIDGKPTVVEAMMGKGVQRVPYDIWIGERKGEVFWLGRIKDISTEKRAAVAATAAAQIGKPYDFWNFNLKDTKAFYCSKLAWYSIFSVTGVPPDDDPDPDRLIWYSPKQLMKSKHVEMILAPGSY